MHQTLRKSVLTILGGMALQSYMVPASAATASQPLSESSSAVSVVLVHGAWADGSSWDKVVPGLLGKGIKVVAVQIPLTSLSDDVAATRRVLDMQPGKVVLVGHSWGGVVISEVGSHAKVAGLVYVAAFAPNDGESVNDLLAIKELPKPPGLGSIRPAPSGYLWLADEGFARDFAQDVPSAQTQLMAVSQKPILGSAFADKVTNAAWKGKPNWYLVANQDRMIPAVAQGELAKRMKARVVAVDASHVPMLSQPQSVVSIILDAVGAMSK